MKVIKKKLNGLLEEVYLKQIIEFIMILKENIVPKITDRQRTIYANEADVINVALFGMAAKEWRDKNLDLDGNKRLCIYTTFISFK